MIRPFLIAIALLVPGVATAQTTEDEKLWVNLTVSAKVGRLLVSGEVQPRWRDGFARYDQLLLRPIVGWQVTDRVQLWQGYVHQVIDLENRGDRREDRTFQQANWNAGRIGPGALTFRLRVEERWRSDAEDTGVRARLLARYALPLGRDRDGVKLIGSVEPFVEFRDTDWRARAGYDQIRFATAVELPAGGRSTTEIGYLARLIDGPGGAKTLDHIATVTFNVRL